MVVGNGGNGLSKWQNLHFWCFGIGVADWSFGIGVDIWVVWFVGNCGDSVHVWVIGLICVVAAIDCGAVTSKVKYLSCVRI